MVITENKDIAADTLDPYLRLFMYSVILRRPAYGAYLVENAAEFTAAVSAARNHDKEVSQDSLERAIQNARDVKLANMGNSLRKNTGAIKEIDNQMD